MGIQGLTSSLIKYINSNTSIITRTTIDNNTTILVDALSVLIPLSRISNKTISIIESKLLFNYSLFNSQLIDFIKLFQLFNIKLRFYFDTALTNNDSDNNIDSYKSIENKRRYNQRLQNLLQIHSLLIKSTGKQYSDIESLLINGSNNNINNVINSIQIGLLVSQSIATLESIGIECISCIGESDHYLANDYLSASINTYYGIISSDSDFSCISSIKWIPLDSIIIKLNSNSNNNNIIDNDIIEYFQSERFLTNNNNNNNINTNTTNNDDNTINCYIITTNTVANCFSIPESRVAEFACLSGNDYTKQYTELLDWNLLINSVTITESTAAAILPQLNQNNNNPRFTDLTTVAKYIQLSSSESESPIASNSYFQSLLSNNTKFQSAYEFALLSYKQPKLAIELLNNGIKTIINNLIDNELLFNDLLLLITERNFPSRTIQILSKSIDSPLITIEAFNNTEEFYYKYNNINNDNNIQLTVIPSTESIIRQLVGAIRLLLLGSNNSESKYEIRIESEFQLNTIDYSELLPNYPDDLIPIANIDNTDDNASNDSNNNNLFYNYLINYLNGNRLSINIRILLLCHPIHYFHCCNYYDNPYTDYIQSESDSDSDNNNDELLLIRIREIFPYTVDSEYRYLVLLFRYWIGSSKSQSVNTPKLNQFIDSAIITALLIQSFNEDYYIEFSPIESNNIIPSILFLSQLSQYTSISNELNQLIKFLLLHSDLIQIIHPYRFINTKLIQYLCESNQNPIELLLELIQNNRIKIYNRSNNNNNELPNNILLSTIESQLTLFDSIKLEIYSVFKSESAIESESESESEPNPIITESEFELDESKLNPDNQSDNNSDIDYSNPIIETIRTGTETGTGTATATANSSDINQPIVTLPIDSHYNEIVNHIATNLLTIIQGDTGSGKSSRIPQFILRDYSNQNRINSRNRIFKLWKSANKLNHKIPGKLKSKPFIIVTQPRRMAAISLANRVAFELGESIGNQVGFAIGQESELNKSTCRILFCTTGWLMEKLVHQPATFINCSHICLDEVHERSCAADLLFVVIKRLMNSIAKLTNNNELLYYTMPSIILMSATFNSDIFAKYFCDSLKSQLINNNSNELIPIKQIPIPLIVGNTRFPLNIYYLDQLLNCPLLKIFQQTPSTACPLMNTQLSNHCKIQLKEKTQSIKSLFPILKWLCYSLAKLHSNIELNPDGNCILVFLPGLMEIENSAELLNELLLTIDYIEIMILHSLVDDQLKVFDPIESGISRIILSTNIAESSLTLPNVRYVIDFGSHKQIRFSEKFECDILESLWISKSSAAQRAGRAGRLCIGNVFRLYSAELYNTIMHPYDLCEMNRISLASTILRLKMSAANSNQTESDIDEESENNNNNLFSDPESVLSDTMDPPPLDRIDIAFKQLIKYEAIELSINSELLGIPLTLKSSKISELGKFYSSLPFSLELGKLIAYGLVFGSKYLSYTIVIACGLSMQDIYLLPHPLQIKDSVKYCKLVYQSTAGRLKSDSGRLSDMLSTIEIINSYCLFISQLPNNISINESNNRLNKWFDDRGIHLKRFKSLLKLISETSIRLSAIVHNPECQLILFQLAKLVSIKPTKPTKTDINVSNKLNSLVNNSKWDSTIDPENQARNDNEHFKSIKINKFQSKSMRINSFHHDRFLPSGLNYSILLITDSIKNIIQFIITASLLNNLMTAELKFSPLKGDKNNESILTIKSLPDELNNIPSIINRPEFSTLKLKSDQVIINKSTATIQFNTNSNNNKSKSIQYYFGDIITNTAVPTLFQPNLSMLSFSRMFKFDKLSINLDSNKPNIDIKFDKRKMLPGCQINWKYFNSTSLLNVSISDRSVLKRLFVFIKSIQPNKSVLLSDYIDLANLDQQKLFHLNMNLNISNTIIENSEDSKSINPIPIPIPIQIPLLYSVGFGMQLAGQSMNCDRINILPTGIFKSIGSLYIALLVKGKLIIKNNLITGIQNEFKLLPLYPVLPIKYLSIIEELKLNLNNLFTGDFINNKSKFQIQSLVELIEQIINPNQINPIKSKLINQYQSYSSAVTTNNNNQNISNKPTTESEINSTKTVNSVITETIAKSSDNAVKNDNIPVITNNNSSFDLIKKNSFLDKYLLNYLINYLSTKPKFQFQFSRLNTDINQYIKLNNSKFKSILINNELTKGWLKLYIKSHNNKFELTANDEHGQNIVKLKGQIESESIKPTVPIISPNIVESDNNNNNNNPLAQYPEANEILLNYISRIIQSRLKSDPFTINQIIEFVNQFSINYKSNSIFNSILTSLPSNWIIRFINSHSDKFQLIKGLKDLYYITMKDNPIATVSESISVSVPTAVIIQSINRNNNIDNNNSSNTLASNDSNLSLISAIYDYVRGCGTSGADLGQLTEYILELINSKQLKIDFNINRSQGWIGRYAKSHPIIFQKYQNSKGNQSFIKIKSKSINIKDYIKSIQSPNQSKINPISQSSSANSVRAQSNNNPISQSQIELITIIYEYLIPFGTKGSHSSQLTEFIIRLIGSKELIIDSNQDQSPGWVNRIILSHPILFEKYLTSNRDQAFIRIKSNSINLKQYFNREVDHQVNSISNQLNSLSIDSNTNNDSNNIDSIIINYIRNLLLESPPNYTKPGATIGGLAKEFVNNNYPNYPTKSGWFTKLIKSKPLLFTIIIEDQLNGQYSIKLNSVNIINSIDSNITNADPEIETETEIEPGSESNSDISVTVGDIELIIIEYIQKFLSNNLPNSTISGNKLISLVLEFMKENCPDFPIEQKWINKLIQSKTDLFTIIIDNQLTGDYSIKLNLNSNNNNNSSLHNDCRINKEENLNNNSIQINNNNSNSNTTPATITINNTTDRNSDIIDCNSIASFNSNTDSNSNTINNSIINYDSNSDSDSDSDTDNNPIEIIINNCILLIPIDYYNNIWNYKFLFSTILLLNCSISKLINFNKGIIEITIEFLSNNNSFEWNNIKEIINSNINLNENNIKIKYKSPIIREFNPIQIISKNYKYSIQYSIEKDSILFNNNNSNNSLLNKLQHSKLNNNIKYHHRHDSDNDNNSILEFELINYSDWINFNEFINNYYRILLLDNNIIYINNSKYIFNTIIKLQSKLILNYILKSIDSQFLIKLNQFGQFIYKQPKSIIDIHLIRIIFYSIKNFEKFEKYIKPIINTVQTIDSKEFIIELNSNSDTVDIDSDYSNTNNNNNRIEFIIESLEKSIEFEREINK